MSLTCGRAGLPHEVVVLLAGEGGALQVAVRVVQERLGAALELLLQLAGRRVQLLLHPLGNKVGSSERGRCLAQTTPFARVTVTHPGLS